MPAQHLMSSLCSLHDNTAVRDGNATDAAISPAAITIEAFGLARCCPTRLDDRARSRTRQDEVDGTGSVFGTHGVGGKGGSEARRWACRRMVRDAQPFLDDCLRYAPWFLYTRYTEDVVCREYAAAQWALIVRVWGWAKRQGN